jgi:putative PIN family toxin of toxin-antitoxin system
MISPRLALDTNIVISAALKPNGVQRTVVLLAMSKPAHWYLSAAILAEYRDVLARPELRIAKGSQRQLLQHIKLHAHLIHPQRCLQVTADPGDNIFLECADAARADYLVTGNLRHFPKFWKGTKVVSSHEFISIVTPHLLP